MRDIPLALTYDDVLLVPRRSMIKHRAQARTRTNLTDTIKLEVPFISANMDTVTEGEMAIAMARAGGIGMIHRYMSIEDQVAEVDRVTRYEGFMIDKPYTVRPDKTLRHVVEKIADNSVSSFMVVGEKGNLLGIVTRRDVIFETDMAKSVAKVMTPMKDLVTVGVRVTQVQAKRVFKSKKIEKLPVVDAKGRLRGLVTARSIVNSEQNTLATKDERGRLRCGAAVGVVGDYLERVEALLGANVDVIVVDVAHGQNIASLSAIKAIRKNFPKVQIVGGNVATKAGVRDLVNAGVDVVKVGIGPGGICSTRTVTGVGVPQLSAVMDCAREAKKRNVRVIADGGTNYPGDIAKALAAGASTVMLAGWFAGTKESPGEVIVRKNRRFKIHRGAASFMSQVDKAVRVGESRQLNTIVPEGVESLIEFKGPVAEIIYQLQGSLRSGMSYCNAGSIAQLQRNARFVRMTSAGFRESRTHNVDEI